MDPMLLAGVYFTAGLVIMIFGAGHFVGAAAEIARRFSIAPAIVGAVIVGFGTSAPELVTSALAAAAGRPALAIGNAAGSNIANLTLVLGVAALVAPVMTRYTGRIRDLAFAGGSTLLLAALVVFDRELSLLDGVVLVGTTVALITWQVVSARRGSRAAGPVEHRPGPATRRLTGMTVLGLAATVGGAHLLVTGAASAATLLGLPDAFVGGVLIAVGTSLPELATALAAARRGETELLIGNLLGSNAFNALAVVGTAALVGARHDAIVVDTATLAVVGLAVVTGAAVTMAMLARTHLHRFAGAAKLATYAACIPILLVVS